MRTRVGGCKVDNSSCINLVQPLVSVSWKSGIDLLRDRLRKMKNEKENESVCKRCHKTYKPSSNTSSSCRFHTSFFVCRRHDDQKRYYELGPNDPPYAAKFYDCCGAENPNALGCTSSFHISYDHHD